MTPRSMTPRPLPEGLEGLADLALDMRWSTRPPADRFWARLDSETWERTRNPYLILQEISDARLQEAARDEELRRDADAALESRRRALESPGWFHRRHGDSGLRGVAYFSMEFGLGESLPIYAGGLGILAGDHLKTASDIGLPLTGIGLLYDRGYFQQQLTWDGWQVEAYPYNDPATLPITPTSAPEGGRLRVTLPLPGRDLVLRVWQAAVGKITLYLLDSNDPQNSPWDRALTSGLYAGDRERRLLQEIVLGLGGWRVLEALGAEPDVCHLNEGHAAFVVPARAAAFMKRHGVSWDEALWATRPGNLFTTHTPVAAGFDRFDAGMVARYLQPFADEMGAPLDEILMLGQDAPFGPFNMAWLAARGSGRINAVSALHETVSRPILAPLVPRWPLAEVPVGHVTNAVHMPTWASDAAQALWAKTHAKDDVPDAIETVSLAADVATPALDRVTDAELWAFRNNARHRLVEYVRQRLVRQVQAQGAPEETLARARQALDANALTLGFARRFATYKRPNLLLRDLERFAHILSNIRRPVQMIVAGKAHPADDPGKRLVQEMARAALRPELLGKIVFLADYDMMLTSELVAGVDVWLNNPRRPMEASGTSGMKVLANGGLNLSELDGWWAEAYTPEVGWALGDGGEHEDEGWDAQEADQLYALLEQEIVPAFYGRGADGLPAAWLRRVRASMTQLTPRFDSPRMLREYVEGFYLPGADAYKKRAADGARLAKELTGWEAGLARGWAGVHLAEWEATRESDQWNISVGVSLDDVDPAAVQVELYADGGKRTDPIRVAMTRDGDSPVYRARVPATRPADDYTPRVIPFHPDALVPQEAPLIAWLDAPRASEEPKDEEPEEASPARSE
ncbi:MAG: alpha-glucan family phosphorylase [Armatimonadetes bacterium]|nr:alpha-glucan family phosphorylase [Armatimonadota bacterium]